MKEKNLLLALALLFISLQSCEIRSKDALEKVSKTNETSEFVSAYDLKYPLSKPLISGHRGAKEYASYPENCLETFQYLRSKVDCFIECDIAETKDGIMVLMHDNSIDRTTNGEGQIKNLTYEELKKLQLKDFKGNLTNYKIPKFSEVLKWAKKSNTVLSVDKKKSVQVSKVIDEIRNHSAEANCIMISYTLKMSQEIYDLAPDLMQSVSIRNKAELARWEKNKIPPADKTIAFTGTRQSPKDLYDEIHRHGITCIFGTLGNIDKQAERKGDGVYKKLLENGVDIIATDRPLEVGLLLDELE